MKTITKDQLAQLAKDFGISHDLDCEYPSIYDFYKGKPFGFEATEIDGDNLAGFRFFGNTKCQDDLLNVWNELVEKTIDKPLLTVELAEKLIGKKIKVSYCDVNEGEYLFTIIAIKEQPSKSMGQNFEKILTTVEDGRGEENYIYEWQGIFRRGSGAERLFVEEIF